MGKANMGKMTRSMATEHKRKPLHLKGRRAADGLVVKSDQDYITQGTHIKGSG